MDGQSDISGTFVAPKGMKLTDVSFNRIREANILELYTLSMAAGIQDDKNLDHCEDLRERLVLMKRKMEGSSNTWKHLFQSVKEETSVKSESLIQLMKTVEATFQTCPIDSLSEVLRKEGHLRNRDLLQEISKRMQKLIEHKSLVVIAGETNGGKSTFINLLLGEDILPTDVLHCTLTICKIVYSDSYSIKTVDYDDCVEHFACSSRDEAKDLLKSKVSQQEMKKRAHGSSIKEITLGLPADILKSGVTLVDTPGIGEDEHMDEVTMNYVKSSHVSAFIYIIKSDTAGGVQEDRLLGFLRAIKDRFSTDTEVEAFDPRAAIFVCHRWDNIDQQQKEKVKKNALNKLEYVWPGFEPSQTFFFSTIKTMKHFPVDPEFVTDSFMDLLKGLKLLFERASHNAIKHQYIWLKYMLQPASRYLRSMITHCIHNNDELDIYFKNVEMKQNKLMLSSAENSKKLESELETLALGLKEDISNCLNFDNISVINEIYECQEIIETCSQEHFLYKKKNRQLLDEMILRCLLKYVDEHIQERKTVHDMEFKMLMAIQEHLGLFQSQINHIKYVMQHGENLSLTPNRSYTSLDSEDVGIQLGSSTLSTVSLESNTSSLEAFREEIILDTTKLAATVRVYLTKRKDGKSRSTNNSKHELQESLMSKVLGKIRYAILYKTEPAVYVEERMRKVAKDIRENREVLSSIVLGYTEWIRQCVNYATNSIPKFIEVNNKLMEEIREHRCNFQRNKDLLRKIMEDLEPSRHHLRGYGMLYMDDINAEMLAFNMEQRTSTVCVPHDLVAEHRLNDDSGFQGSGSKRAKVQSLWAKMQGATIKINNAAEKVVVKTYIYDMDDKAVFSEIASLRCLEHSNLASFLGMTRIVATDSIRGGGAEVENFTEKVSAFIFKGDLVSANVYSRRKITNLQQFVPEFVHFLLQGLNFIHREGLVHMELNMDTVMVDRVTGMVKLCQMCKPREARFPANLNTHTQSCICLSPNVLQGHVYEATDDIYAFGLLLWELLFPDEPPYKIQKTWPLKRFIEECHPTSMLKEQLMQLKVSENIREILEGTLLVHRGKICMPITTVKRLMVDFSNEPAVQHMRARREPVVYRRTNSGFLYLSKIDLGTTNATVIGTPAHTLSTMSTPQRPPRKKDKLKETASTETTEINNNKKVFPPKESRRKSEPIYAINLSKSPQIKSKNNIFSKFSKALKRRSSKAQVNENLQEMDQIASVHMNISTEASSEFQDDTDRNGASTKHNEHSTPKLKQKVTSEHVKKDNVPQPRLRRYSLQDQSLFGPRKVSGQEQDGNVDVPSLMFRNYSNSTNLGNKFFENDSPVINLQSALLNSSTPFITISDEHGRDTLYRKKHSIGSNIGISPQSLYSASKQGNNYLLLESRKNKVLVPLSPSRHRNVVFKESLQDLTDSSGSQIIHTTGLGAQSKFKATGVHHTQERLLSPRLGNSLQDVSKPSHSIEPILEEKGDAPLCDRAQNSVIVRNVDPSLQKNYEFNRLSSPAAYGEHKLSPMYGTTGKEDVHVISSVASSLSSLECDSEFSIGLSKEEQNINFGSTDGFIVDSNFDQNDFILKRRIAKKNSKHQRNLSFELNKSQSIPFNNFANTSQLPENENNLLEARRNSYSDHRDSPAVFSGDSFEGIKHFSFGGTNNNSGLTSSSSQTLEASSVPPPPPAIDFSKLCFGKGTYSDDDDD